MRYGLIIVALLAVGCRFKTPQNIRKDQGTRTAKSWCDPHRGIPADPTLGLEAPIQLGVGSIVHERDSTTESFVAARAFTQLIEVPERKLAVSVIDHPTDADYSIMGSVRGDVKYARETDMGPIGWTGYMSGSLGYMVGGTMLGTTLLIDAISSSEGESSRATINVLKTIGIVGLGLGVAGNIALATRPSNRYSWDQTSILTLRRGTVVIGEFEVRDVHDRVQWSVIDEPRRASTRKLWQRAAHEIGACIAADLGGLFTRSQVAEVP